jgi:hypothetical protein
MRSGGRSPIIGELSCSDRHDMYCGGVLLVGYIPWSLLIVCSSKSRLIYIIFLLGVAY